MTKMSNSTLKKFYIQFFKLGQEHPMIDVEEFKVILEDSIEKYLDKEPLKKESIRKNTTVKKERNENLSQEDKDSLNNLTTDYFLNNS